MQLLHHLVTFNDALQKNPRLLLNKMSDMNCCLCKEWLDRRNSLYTPAS